MASNEQDLLTVQDVANRFGVKPTTIRKWLRDGQIRGVKIGGARRFERSEVDRLIAEGRDAA